MKEQKAPLTRMQRRWLLNYYCRKILSARQIQQTYGWTIEELSLIRPKSEEHYLTRCPKCQSKNIAMNRHYTNMGISCVNAVCRECGTYSHAKDYESAMVLWNQGKVHLSH